jgi:hypothetical protein
MKKQISILAVTITAIIFFSCSKKENEIPQSKASTDSQAMSNQVAQQLIFIDPLEIGLTGRYEFDGNLKDKTGQLQDASTTIGTAFYTTDRKGMSGRAIKFDGKYASYIWSVPHSPKMSLAAWVKYGNASSSADVFVNSQSDGPQFEQAFDQYYGYNNSSGNPWIASGSIDNKWHHLVATIDGTTLRFYVDGNLKGSVTSPDVETTSLAYYRIGFGPVTYKYWLGAIDDLRFYNRTLSASDVVSLYQL